MPYRDTQIEGREVAVIVDFDTCPSISMR